MQLNITSPCSENWNKMLPNNKGRHCSSCKKTVIDIRSKSQLEIKLLIDSNVSVCAIANNNQLSDYQFVKPIKRLAFALLIVFGNALFSISATAQEATQQLKETYLKSDSTETFSTLTGTVIDEDGEPIIFANITLFLNDKFLTGAATDFDGNYKIELDTSFLGKQLKLEVHFVEYESKKQIIKITKGIIKNDFVLEDHIGLIGEVILINKKLINKNPVNANKTTFKRK